MGNKILIVGYGNIGKHMYQEFEKLQPDIYDPNIEEYSKKSKKQYDFAFICVPTDKLPDGSCDTSIVESAVKDTDAEIIVIKSTIPPRTTDKLIRETEKRLVFSPEYYGTTQHCKKDPGFVVLGGNKELRDCVANLYNQVKNGYYKFYFTDTVTAELAKYMENCFLALKVTFCCEFADIAKKFGVSYPELRELFAADERVGNSHTFVYPDKPYYDSHCFNKDIPALVNFAGKNAPLMTCVNQLNLERKKKTVKQNVMYVGNAPKELAEDTMRLRERRLGERREKYLEQTRKAQFKYYCSVCLIIRDENEYLEEWLRWHIGQGVEHFYIYDHGSTKPVKDFVLSLGSEISEKVTVTDWSGKHKDAQPEAYNDCLKRYRGESRWIGFIDADEQVRVKTGQSLPAFLKDYEDYAGVFAVWITYDANGQVKQTNEPLRKRFTRINTNDQWAIKAGKVFVQPLFMRDMVIHNGSPELGFDVVDEHKNVVAPYSLVCDHATIDFICVDHYYTKSYEEWVNKIKRGSGHAQYQRKYDEFFRINTDMEYCREDITMKQKYNI